MSHKKEALLPDFSAENFYPNLVVVGIDEVGRGPIAGPVVSACVLLNQNHFPRGINDSKKISKIKRGKIFKELQKIALSGLGIVDSGKIDEINILEAAKLSMLLAYQDFCEKNKIFPDIILVDGNIIPFAKRDKIREIIALVKGDQKSLSIAAASIFAKENRDLMMKNFADEFPEYGFEKHAGYGTKMHLEQIKKFGICHLHRRSFEPIKSMISRDENN